MPGNKPKCLEYAKPLAQLIEAGKSRYAAANEIGLKECTLDLWVRNGKKANRKSVYQDFYRIVLAAEEKRKQNLVDQLFKAANNTKPEKIVERNITTQDEKGNPVKAKVIEKTPGPDLSTAKWLLSRMHPDEWGQRAKLDIRHEGETAQVVILPQMPDEVKQLMDEQGADPEENSPQTDDSTSD